MTHAKLNRLIALGIFLVSLGTYTITVSPTVVFWDVGEFCAAAYLLQVPHPPGAPLFLLIARIASMVPLVEDIAVRMHMMSAVSSAVSCAMVYLIGLKFILLWRGVPSTGFDRWMVYGSAAVGALSMTFSKTFWFNAVEAEVYGLSMFFVSAIVWLGLRWYERADRETGDRYLLLIAYMVGLSVGVHLLAILAIFVVMLLFYFRYYEFSVTSFAKFGLGATAVFAVIYPGVVKELPSMLDGEFMGKRSEFFTYLPLMLIAVALYYVYRSNRERKRLLNLAVLSFLFIVLGFSTYSMVYIRANAKPPMNENDPSTMARLVSYLNREQYGSAPMVQRRWDPDPEKQRIHQTYRSDFDYFWRYQLNHMYFRYLGWNFVGSAGDEKESGVDWNKLYGIPLLLGLWGAYYHWKKDPKMAFVGTSFFLLMGIILVVYFNMQEPQPRERDYFFVGSFFVFSMWIGMGVLGAIDTIREKLQNAGQARLASYAVLGLAFVFVPANMASTNFKAANRSGNYVAWDYSYNLLQSCEPDAILFTNGDNDTFPLWYLQDVEGIRRDIRIVNLSLLNTSWYILQLKNEEPHGAKKVPISTSDAEINSIGPFQFDGRMMDLPVPRHIVEQYTVEGSPRTVLDTSVTKHGFLRFYLAPTMDFGNIKALRVQDGMVYDIIRSSNWQRPIYFAMTVSDDGKIGLGNHLRLTGLAFKLSPRKTSSYIENIDPAAIRANVFADVPSASKEWRPGFLWRGLDDSTTYFDEDSRRLLVSNYRSLFFSLAQYYASVEGRMDLITEVLDRMEACVPRRSIPMDYRVKFDVASFYNMGGNRDQFTVLTREIIGDIQGMMARGPITEPLSQYNPYIILYYSYDGMNMFQEAEDLLPVIQSAYATTEGIEQIIGQLRTQVLARRASASAALPQPDTLAKGN